MPLPHSIRSLLVFAVRLAQSDREAKGREILRSKHLHPDPVGLSSVLTKEAQAYADLAKSILGNGLSLTSHVVELEAENQLLAEKLAEATGTIDKLREQIGKAAKAMVAQAEDALRRPLVEPSLAELRLARLRKRAEHEDVSLSTRGPVFHIETVVPVGSEAGARISGRGGTLEHAIDRLDAVAHNRLLGNFVARKDRYDDYVKATQIQTGHTPISEDAYNDLLSPRL